MKKQLTFILFGTLLLASCGSESMDDDGPNPDPDPDPSPTTGTLYTGPSITFQKAGFADPTQEANQDRITDAVWITRGDRQGIYNAVSETSYSKNSSPSGTEWAEGRLSSFQSLNYADWETAVGGNPPGSVGKTYVVHLISEDIYLELEVLAWGQRSTSGGSFSYRRTTPAP